MSALRTRPFDAVLCAAFGGFALSTFTVDLWAVTGRIHGDDALARLLRGYTESADPLFGLMPFYVRVIMAISLFAFGPMQVATVYALARCREWIRTPGLVYAGAQMTTMASYFGFEALGDHPPRSWPVVLAANVPYFLFPALLAWRLRRGPVFATPARA